MFSFDSLNSVFGRRPFKKSRRRNVAAVIKIYGVGVAIRI